MNDTPKTTHELLRETLLHQNELLEVLATGIRRQNELLETFLANGGRVPLPARPNEAIAPMRPTGIAPQVAPPEDLDSQWGDPEIRKDPPKWSGPSYQGARYSQCPREYLEALAGYLDWMAGKADEKHETAKNGTPRSKYIRSDAARARGWALRNAKKGGMHRQADPPPNSPADVGYQGSDDDIPF